MIGGSNLQKNGVLRAQQRCDECTPHTHSAKFGGHRQVENFDFARRQRASDQEPGNVSSAEGYAEIMLQVFCGIPLRGLRARVLDGGDRSHVRDISMANYWHIIVMARALTAMLFFLAQPFWELKPPEQWTDREIDTVRHLSPWVQVVGPEPTVRVYFATAAPIEQAEAEARARFKKRAAETEPDPDYLNYVRENRENQFVLAIPYATLSGLGRAEEDRRMEQETVMLIGRKQYHLVGHYPPVPSDPVLRLIFPRELRPTDKSVVFRLYLPGVNFPDREAEFRVKELMYHGKLEM